MIERINLQLFAGGSAGEKTEKATPKKRNDARKKGQVLQSREISSAMVLMFVFVTVRILGSNIYNQITSYTKYVLTEYPQLENFSDVLPRMFVDSVTVILKIAGPILAVALLAGTAASYAQVGFLFTLETLSVKFSRINPLTGMKRIFSMRGLVELLKSVLKIIIIGYVAYAYINSQAADMLRTMDMDVMAIASFIGQTTLNVAIRICVALVLLGILDYAYQWWEYEKSLRMSKQEVKEEYKQTEGNPEIKSKIKQKQRQLSLRRMMQEVPKADVVITNPTHFACAIKYDSGVALAPVVVAKGQDYLALRIKETARENNVEIVENKVLARTIYETVDIGEAIPQELYQAVAEILAFVYSLKGKTRAG